MLPPSVYTACRCRKSNVSILGLILEPASTFRCGLGRSVDLDFLGSVVRLFDVALLRFTPSSIAGGLTAILVSTTEPALVFGGRDLDQVLIHRLL
jgi:hypothetical protein